MMEQWQFNQEAEEALVGALFLEEGLIKDCNIRPEQLYLPKLQRLLSTMKRLDEKGRPIDVISVVEEVGEQNLESIGGISYITELAGSVPTTANFKYYQDIVREYYQKRRAKEVAGRIMDEVARAEDIRKTISDGIHNLMEIEGANGDDELGDIKSCLVDLYNDCEKDSGEISGVPSGFKKLDRLTGGFQESDLIVIGARPSMGKTAFALNIALNASEHDVSVIFSLEMSKNQLVKRAAGFRGNIDSTKMRNPRRFFADEDWRHLYSAMGEISHHNLHIFDRPGMDVNYIWSKVRKMKREYAEGTRFLVVIDYLQLIVGDPRHKQNRQAEISEISRSLKHMARELNVVVIALSQLSRGVESRQDKRPMLSDLRESGQIEQDSDVIAFLYRDDYYDKEAESKNTIDIIVAKQRNGPVGTVELSFNKEYGKFADLGV
ncbi:replicative DNA helicase [Bacillus sp. T33-2]|uniref:replicative DNA helicase n=1 Tax=Bacillus sp. T33-2 TaxID=2054168 RepID=UPI000C7887B2|nr:replicative DNA helicase [Bacillus sp. T33-2]PLR95735.1 replicative DNA helicase [Bacillus sp. T33-2]